ncbi:MAG: peptide chain release factor N(5)-glutamine methyltransferase [Ruminococcaceae bacterium]|nr:peptide chain release factor N(5)-glutamine methyltransferase [Oscillospiraceae bacterium]
MTYNEICMTLANAEIENNRGETAMLICHFCNVTKADLLLRRDEDFDSPELVAAVEKRCQHYPLQYILGYWNFCNETYKVTENTLIPRQDTEKLVELAIKLLPENARIIDLCTGSGCVAISTLAARTDCHAVAVDLFSETLEIARENAESNGVGDRMGFLAQDVLYPAFMNSLGKFDCILSNPPYIETHQISLLDDELFYEPRAALDGGDDGLDFYRVIISEYGEYLSDSGIMLLEIGCDQAKSISALASAAGMRCEIYKDYGGNDRVAYLKKAAIRTEEADIAPEN